MNMIELKNLYSNKSIVDEVYTFPTTDKNSTTDLVDQLHQFPKPEDTVEKFYAESKTIFY